MYTAQLGVQLQVTPGALTLSASGRSYQLDRVNFDGLSLTSILGVFKRGIVFHHHQQDLPSNLVFYPTVPREDLMEKIEHLGWS